MRSKALLLLVLAFTVIPGRAALAYYTEDMSAETPLNSSDLMYYGSEVVNGYGQGCVATYDANGKAPNNPALFESILKESQDRVLEKAQYREQLRYEKEGIPLKRQDQLKSLFSSAFQDGFAEGSKHARSVIAEGKTDDELVKSEREAVEILVFRKSSKLGQTATQSKAVSDSIKAKISNYGTDSLSK